MAIMDMSMDVEDEFIDISISIVTVLVVLRDPILRDELMGAVRRSPCRRREYSFLFNFNYSFSQWCSLQLAASNVPVLPRVLYKRLFLLG